MDVMFEIPSTPNVKECIIDEEVITKGKTPKLVYRTEEELEDQTKKDDSAESA